MTKKSVQNNEWCDYLLQILVILQFWKIHFSFVGSGRFLLHNIFSSMPFCGLLLAKKALGFMGDAELPEEASVRSIFRRGRASASGPQGGINPPYQHLHHPTKRAHKRGTMTTT